jgi:hypothetical protein
LIGVGLLYVIAYGWLLRSTDALPYVLDNNESFSSYIHGANMFHFGVANSFGLTDEAFSPDAAAAHPYVYTHGGNFPRIFSYMLYALGARTVQAQIVIATFTVGILGLFFIYAYFARLAGVAFAALTCLVFGSDYLFFAQWQVNSYRVWHTFFLFAALLCLHAVSGKRRRLFLGLLFATEACLVYFDLTFALFVSVFAGLYAAVLYRRQLGLLARVWATQLVAAVATVALLVAQSVAYLGWSAFAFDIGQVYGTRNSPLAGTGQGDRLVAQLQDFYASHHVVFWPLLGANASLRDAGYFVRESFSFTLEPLTRLFSLIVLLIFGGWLLGLVRLPPPGNLTPKGAVPLAAATVVMLFLASFVAAFSVLGYLPSPGVDAAGPVSLVSPQVGLAVIFAFLMLLGMTRLATGSWHRFASLPFVRVALASGLLLVAAAFTSNSATFYDQQLQPLALLGAWLPAPVATSILLLTLGLAAGLVLTNTPIFERPTLVVYLVCGLLAYGVAYLALPGYVVSAYLERTAPLTVYGRDVVVAIALFVLGTLVVRAASERRASVPMRGLAAAAAGALLVVLGAYWLNVQRQFMVELLPPTHYSAFLTQLSEPPFRGASFATNMYPASVAAQTGQWAYTDQSLGRGEVNLGADGYTVARDWTYLWMADAQTNPVYTAPDYYLCVIQQNLSTAIDRLAGKAEGGCGQLGLVRLAGQDVPFPHDKVVAGDPTGRDNWAVVSLDWHYPPYLAPLDPSARTLVSAEVSGDDAHWFVKPVFSARQQTGEPQQPAQLRLYATGSQTCLISSTADPSGFALPASYSNLVTLSVTPNTTASGQEVFSEPIYVGVATYLLPDARTGGYQQVRAISVQDAEQRAAAAGAWDAQAAAGLSFFTLPDIQSGAAQEVLAHSIDEAKNVAQSAGTWNEKAGTYGVTSLGATLSRHIETCQG